jgi:hypothetical protein
LHPITHAFNEIGKKAIALTAYRSDDPKFSEISATLTGASDEVNKVFKYPITRRDGGNLHGVTLQNVRREAWN